MTDCPKFIRVASRLFDPTRVEKFCTAWSDPTFTVRECADFLGVAKGSAYYFAEHLGLGPRKMASARFRERKVLPSISLRSKTPFQRHSFNFKRFVQPVPQSGIEIRGDVPVRRFEAGCSTVMIQHVMEQEGMMVKPVGCNLYEIRKIGAKGRGKRITLADLIAHVDKARIANGQQPISKQNART